MELGSRYASTLIPKFNFFFFILWDFSGGLSDKKNPPSDAGDIRDSGSIPGLGRSSGGGYSNPPQYFLPGESHGQWSLVGYRPWGCTRVGLK